MFYIPTTISKSIYLNIQFSRYKSIQSRVDGNYRLVTLSMFLRLYGKRKLEDTIAIKSDWKIVVNYNLNNIFAYNLV